MKGKRANFGFISLEDDDVVERIVLDGPHTIKTNMVRAAPPRRQRGDRLPCLSCFAKQALPARCRAPAARHQVPPGLRRSAATLLIRFGASSTSAQRSTAQVEAEVAREKAASPAEGDELEEEEEAADMVAPTPENLATAVQPAGDNTAHRLANSVLRSSSGVFSDQRARTPRASLAVREVGCALIHG